MAKPMRHDFVSAAVGLTLTGQRKNLSKLHDWLVDEIGLAPGEEVLALTNYQEGRFGRLPTHILLVTNRRVAFTHDQGLRAIPLVDIDTSRVGLNAGIVNGEITLVTRDGETLDFRRGMSIGMQQVASALEMLATAAPANTTSREPAQRSAPTSRPQTPASGSDRDPSNGAWAGRGDEVIQFSPTEGLVPLRVEGGGPGESLTVWSLTPDLARSDLLVNTSDIYRGVCLAGVYGQVAGFQINAVGTWVLEPLSVEDLPALSDAQDGSGDAVIMTLAGASMTQLPTVIRVEAASTGAIQMWAHGSAPDLLINAAYSYEGTVIVPAGTLLLALTCDGGWNITT